MPRPAEAFYTATLEFLCLRVEDEAKQLLHNQDCGAKPGAGNLSQQDWRRSTGSDYSQCLETHTSQPWLLGKFLLLTWQGWCSSADSRTGRSRGWCRRRPVSTRSAGWGRWPRPEVGTGPGRRAGSPVGTGPAPLARPAECVPERQQRTIPTDWLTDSLTELFSSTGPQIRHCCNESDGNNRHLPSSGSPLGPEAGPQLWPPPSARLPRRSAPAPGSANKNNGHRKFGKRKGKKSSPQQQGKNISQVVTIPTS